jgi:hypothetical protein
MSRGIFQKIQLFSNFLKRFMDRCPFAIDEAGKIGYDKIWRDV